MALLHGGLAETREVSRSLAREVALDTLFKVMSQ
jgi:hypothetical protein